MWPSAEAAHLKSHPEIYEIMTLRQDRIAYAIIVFHAGT